MNITVVCLIIMLLLFSTALATAQESAWHSTGRKGAVVAGGRPAMEAGLAALRQGGNAADAAVATILALSVTDSEKFCFGSEVSILVYDARRNVVEVVSGQGVAPRLATLEHFAGRGIPNSGPEAATVPGVLDACLTLLDRYGTWTFAQAVQPTLSLLDRNRQPWHVDLARTLRRLIDAERAGGDRRRCLRLVADCFYRGPVAHELDAWSRANGGLIRYSDMATHVTRIEEPVHTDYRGYSVYKCGPWTQGPCLLQALKILEGFDIKALGRHSAASVHLLLEATKLAMADRDTYFGDPLFVDVPLAKLMDPSYIVARRALIDPRKASLEYRPGDAGMVPPGAAPAPGRQMDTTTCVVVDEARNVIAATPSGWGGAMAGATGIRLGSRLQSFNTTPGHPNCLEPGKRPRSTLTPTLVLRDGRPVLALSVAGGDAQDQAMLQMLSDYSDYGVSVRDIVRAPRYITNHLIGSFGQPRPQPGSVQAGNDLPAMLVEELTAMGHRISQSQEGPEYERAMIEIDAAGGELRAAGDPAYSRNAGGM